MEKIKYKRQKGYYKIIKVKSVSGNDSFVSPVVGAERIFKAMANSRRLQIIKLLKNKKKFTVGEIAGEIKLSFKSTSKHLIILSLAKIINKEQKGLEVRYFISDEIIHPSIRTIIDISTIL